MNSKILLTILVLITLSCGNDDPNPDSNYKPPVSEADGWKVSRLEEQGITRLEIEDLTKAILSNEFTGIHSLLIIRNGHLVYERYFNGYDKNDLHELYSVTKSFSSALVGISIQRGLIENEEQPLLNLLPNNLTNDRQELANIQLRHLLKMSSGMAWDEFSTSYTNPNNNHYRMMNSPSAIEYVLERPVIHDTDKIFAYNTGLSNVIAPIIEYASSETIERFAERYLFQPLDIHSFQWDTTIDHYPSTGGSFGGLMLRPRDMAKWGQLFLDEGRWNGTRILEEQYVTKSTQDSIYVNRSNNYGYQLWMRQFFSHDQQPLHEYDAAGDGGQFVFVFPKLQLVVATTGGNNTWIVDPMDMYQPIDMIREYILPAVGE